MTAHKALEMADRLITPSSVHGADCYEAAAMLRTIPKLEASCEAWKIMAKGYWKVIDSQQAEIERLKQSLKEIIAISDRKHDAWDKAKELLTEHNRPDFFYMEHDLQGDRND